MTLKRFALVLLTAFVVVKMLLSLGGSLAEPQVQGRLDLYQADLILQVTAGEFDAARAPLRDALLGADPYAAVAEKYERAREDSLAMRDRLAGRISELRADETGDAEATPAANTTTGNDAIDQIEAARRDLEGFIAEIDLKQGWLHLERGDRAAAEAAWGAAKASNIAPFARAAEVSLGLWQVSPRVLPDARDRLDLALAGWFRYRSLSRLYEVTQRPQDVQALAATATATAETALTKLAIIGGIPIVGALIGVGLAIFLGMQWSLARSGSLLVQNGNRRWETPWDAEVTWQAIVVGFFGISQIALPLLLGISGFDPTDWSIRGKALFVFGSYLAMAAGGIIVLWASIAPYLPLPEGWFSLKGNWLGWGVGGYFVAVPVVIVVSLVNQQIWQGQGGSNPLLYLALQAQDGLALGLFLATAAVLAPVFEEIMFRGFLLPALTRYFPVWGAIALSALLFSLAHLSLSEVLPLAALGSVLGFVYTRSRSLLAPILLHGLWNSGTLASLFVLGSGAG